MAGRGNVQGRAGLRERMVVDQDVVRAVAENAVQRDASTHDWEQAVAVHGLLETGIEACVEAAHEAVDDAVAAQTSAGEFAYGPFDVTECSPREHRSYVGTPAFGVGALAIYDRTGDDAYLDAARRQYEFLADARRTADGAISTFADEVEVWVDSVYMLAPFLFRYGEAASDPDAVDEAVRTLSVYSEHLRDDRTGLYRHSWIETPDSFRDSTLWARGNGWAALSLVDALDRLPASHEAVPALRSYFLDLADAVVSLQDRSGLWHDLLDDPESQLEVSGTAALAAALARGVDVGVLDADDHAPVAERAMAACVRAVDDDGAVRRVSGPPGGPGCPLGDHLFGQGLFLLAAAQFLA